jgi:hypothetical protein
MSEGKHWVTAIRESVKGGAYNIAAPGWGPMQEWLALEEFGLPLKPKVVVWAFCEGNDLLDAELFQTFNERPDKSLTWADFQAIRFGLPPQRFPYTRPFVRLLLSLAERLNPPPPMASGGGEENAGPVVIEMKNGASAVALDPGAFHQMLKSEAGVRDSVGMQITANVINGAISICRRQGIKFVLVFFPAKSRACLPLVEREADREEFYKSIVPTLPQDERVGAARFFEELRENEPSVARVLSELCESKNDEGVIFIDLTGPIRGEVREGVMPYWPYDSHLNIAGHAIAAETILNSLRQRNILPPAE